MTTLTDSLREHGLGQHDLRLSEQDRIDIVGAIREVNVSTDMPIEALKPLLDSRYGVGTVDPQDVALATVPVGGFTLKLTSDTPGPARPFHIEVTATGVEGLNDTNVNYSVNRRGGGHAPNRIIQTAKTSFNIHVDYPGTYDIEQTVGWAGKGGLIRHHATIEMPLNGLEGGTIPSTTGDPDPFHPGDHTYAEIRAHVGMYLESDGDPVDADALAEIQRIKDAEVAGKNRTRVVNWLDAIQGVI